MVDKVKPLKVEDATSGTESNPFPTETDPAEDYLAAKGVAFENVDTHLIYRDGADIKVTDPTVGTRSMNDLRTDNQNSFDGSAASPAFTATDVRAAIIEARDTAEGTTARFGIQFGNLGNTKNKYLEYFAGVSSDSTPFVTAEDLEIVAISAAVAGPDTGDIEIYKNSSTLIYTINIVASSIFTINSLTIALSATDTLSAKVTNAAALTDPVVTIFAKVTP